ncbi:hypothetical protein QQG91_09895 [Marivivens sp. LCG002]|uniref:hypothetical protein n=1 Tax=Marivivens sp. LCG002 TaxID=3051171 RepID=UPI002553BF0D|nr:hypothetical protein [Marivivens sp. LCG002]WIV49980.1 hypothetical protein QQG91_09895 [Marivivens sp. LCG002]
MVQWSEASATQLHAEPFIRAIIEEARGARGIALPEQGIHSRCLYSDFRAYVQTNFEGVSFALAGADNPNLQALVLSLETPSILESRTLHTGRRALSRQAAKAIAVLDLRLVFVHQRIAEVPLEREGRVAQDLRIVVGFDEGCDPRALIEEVAQALAPLGFKVQLVDGFCGLREAAFVPHEMVHLIGWRKDAITDFDEATEGAKLVKSSASLIAQRKQHAQEKVRPVLVNDLKRRAMQLVSLREYQRRAQSEEAVDIATETETPRASVEEVEPDRSDLKHWSGRARNAALKLVSERAAQAEYAKLRHTVLSSLAGETPFGFEVTSRGPPFRS